MEGTSDGRSSPLGELDQSKSSNLSSRVGFRAAGSESEREVA